MGVELEKALAKNPNLFISKKGCPYCKKAIGILNLKRVRFDLYEYTEYEALVTEVKNENNFYTYPMIFLRGKFVGGCSDIQDMLM